MDAHTSNRLRVVAALILKDGDDQAAITDYMSDEDRDVCAKLIPAYSREKIDCDQLIRHMLSGERFSSVAEVHPSWILENLKNESPRIMGIILRSLPSKHVRYVLKNLPPMVREQIPMMVESFAVAAPVLGVIRRNFERKFEPMCASRALDWLSFDELYYLKTDELEDVVYELGLCELAMAIKGMSSKTLHVVLNRLELKDAKRLQKKMRELSGISVELVRQARFTVLEVEAKHVGAKRMLLEIGLAGLAAAVCRDHARLVKLLVQKLDLGLGYLFKRFVEARQMGFCESLAETRREIVLSTVAQLAREERISPNWARFLEVKEQPAPNVQKGEDFHTPKDEDTATLEQLA